MALFPSYARLCIAINMIDIKHVGRRAARLAALASTLATGGCDGRTGETVQRGDSIPGDLAAAGSFGAAVIRGRVRFIGTPPDNPAIDMRGAPLCRGVYHSIPRQLSVIVNPNGTLANVFVYVKRGLPSDVHYSPPADALLLAQRGCQYRPRVLGLMVGQTLTIRNDDAVEHVIDASGVKTRAFAIPLAAGRSGDHVFHASEVMVPLRGRTHRWMRAYIGVLPHPFFATTGDDGRFTIPRLPPGTYTLEAWHEGYGRRAATVTVRDSSTQTVTFTYTPMAAETAEY
jgi:hypothetical protein